MIKTIKDFNFKNKKILIRVDYNVPMDDDGNITDDFRIRETLPTINFILKQMPSQVILMAHIGRPKGTVPDKEPELKTNKVAERLGKLLNLPVKKVDGWQVASNCKDCIIMLENLRFNPAEQAKDVKLKDAFGKQLAGLADIYVDDAFSNSHRDDASMTSVPKFVQGCIGFLIKKEYDMITLTIEDPVKPFISIIGGVKADKLNAIEHLLKTADKILIGGALAFLFLKVNGYSVGKTSIDTKGLTPETEAKIKQYLNNPKIILPVDAVVAKSTDINSLDINNLDISNPTKAKIVDVNKIPDDMMALDIGPKSIERFSLIIKQAKTIVWNGPIGYFENPVFANGTKKIAKLISECKAKSIVGGGDSAAAVTQFGYDKKMTHVSSGGGASLILIEGKELVAVKALER